MTSSFQRGWNGPKVTGEKGLWIFVAKDDTETAYYKGRINGVSSSPKLEGSTITEWRREAARLRGDKVAAEKVAGDRRTTVDQYVDTFLAAQWKKVGHRNERLQRSRKSVQNDQERLTQFVQGSKLGRKKLGDVRLKHLRDFVEDMYALETKHGKPYADNTLRDVVRLLGSLFREARKDELIPFNPMLEFPADERPSSKSKHEKRKLTPKQVDALVAQAGTTFGPIILVLGWVGLRISEALGLTWADFDLEAGTIRVELQLDGDERVGLKTDNSYAEVPLLSWVVTALKAHKRAMAERGLQYVRPDALVFVTEFGKPQNGRNTLRALHRAGDELGYNEGPKKVDNHSLRHSFISNALAAGMTIPEVALLARNDVETIARYYAAVPEDDRPKAAAKLEKALARA